MNMLIMCVHSKYIYVHSNTAAVIVTTAVTVAFSLSSSKKNKVIFRNS